MKPTNTHSQYQFQCPQCESYFWVDCPDWPDDKPCPSCKARDRRKKHQHKVRGRWWPENEHLRGAKLEDVWVEADGVDVLYLRAIDGTLWKVYINRGFERGEEELRFERVTKDNTLLAD